MLAGAGSQAEAGVEADLGSDEWWDWGRRGRSGFEGEGSNELAAMQGYRNTAWFFLHCEASILTAAEMKGEEICFTLSLPVSFIFCLLVFHVIFHGLQI